MDITRNKFQAVITCVSLFIAGKRQSGTGLGDLASRTWRCVSSCVSERDCKRGVHEGSLHDRCSWWVLKPMLTTHNDLTAMFPGEPVLSVVWRCWLGLASRRASGHNNWVIKCWHGYLFGARFRLFVYGPTDATAVSKLHHLLPHWLYLSGTGLSRCPWKRASHQLVLNLECQLIQVDL